MQFCPFVGLLTLCRFTLYCVFDRLSFDPKSFYTMSFDPTVFDPMSVNQPNCTIVSFVAFFLVHSIQKSLVG